MMKMGSECSDSGGLDIVVIVDSSLMPNERVSFLFPIFYILIVYHCYLSFPSRPSLMIGDDGCSKLQFLFVTRVLRRQTLALLMLA